MARQRLFSVYSTGRRWSRRSGLYGDKADSFSWVFRYPASSTPIQKVAMPGGLLTFITATIRQQLATPGALARAAFAVIFSPETSSTSGTNGRRLLMSKAI